MKKLCLFIVIMCALSSLSHAQLSPFGFANPKLSCRETLWLDNSMDCERLLKSPGLMLTASQNNFAPGNSGESKEYDVLRHQKGAMNVLLGWSGASVIAGSAMLFHESRTIRDLGIQNVAWGVIDGGIALYARRSITRKRGSGISVQKERNSFRKLLLINSLLDVAYVGVGTALAASGRDNLKGHGYGIIVQGAFLLLFDGVNLLLIPKT
jgi:hypothetical protein